MFWGSRASIRFVRPSALAIAALLLTAGCRPAVPNRGTTPGAADAVAGAGACHAEQGDTRPLLVEWPAADRAQLEAAANQGLVAVRYDGCQLQVLSRCELEGSYDYHALTAKRDQLRIRDRDALWAELPLGAARLEAALAREGQLNVDMAVVGQRDANISHVRATGSSSACHGATHVVTAMTVGAFSVYTGSAISGNVSASAAGAGGGGSIARETEILRRDGDLSRCGEAPSADATPPAQCGALLRVELSPLGSGGALMSEDDSRKADEASKLRRSAERWEGTRQGALIGSGIAAAGTVGSLVFVVVRSVQITSAEFDRDREAMTADDGSPITTAAERARAADRVAELESDIDRYQSSRRTAGFLAVGLAVGTAGLLGLAAGARKRSHTLRRRADTLSVAPLLGPGQGGLGLSGRF